MTRAGARVLIVSEGSGGHLIPALETAACLARQGVETHLSYAQRAQLSGLSEALVARAVEAGVSVMPSVDPVASRAPAWLGRPGAVAAGTVTRLRRAASAWAVARALVPALRPSAVVGFGGLFSAAFLLVAKQRGVVTILHEQNVTLGRANRLLAGWVDRVAVSFEPTLIELASRRSWIRAGGRIDAQLTGLPLRPEVGTMSRDEAAKRLGLNPAAPTVLVLGGSQGSQAINRLIEGVLRQLSPTERGEWQWIHLAGSQGAVAMERTYRSASIQRARIAPHAADMAAVYAAADVAVGRAGASTVSELIRCGLPSVLIPYPYARSHQRENAKLIASLGGAWWVDEAVASPERLLSRLREALGDASRHAAMRRALFAAAHPDATEHLANLIRDLITTQQARVITRPLTAREATT